ncbi:hypothetical protein V6N13_113754 [Hibiscus sabdariffa]|uniref:Uncharacterized protein n=1 Tax=Hibiscus sabdariffa TaxID=183260 RepID=A0ABR2TZU4_9ROSI
MKSFLRGVKEIQAIRAQGFTINLPQGSKPDRRMDVIEFIEDAGVRGSFVVMGPNGKPYDDPPFVLVLS